MTDTVATNAPSAVGYKQPPRSTRFQKGRSGNPKGRPPNRHKQFPYDTVLGQMVTIREDGHERRVTAAEAFLLQLTRKGLQGDSAAARASLAAIEAARDRGGHGAEQRILKIQVISYGVDTVLGILGLGIKHNRLDRQKARWSLHPWVIEAGLARLGDRVLTREEQCEVWATTRNPEKVQWPEWWAERS